MTKAKKANLRDLIAATGFVISNEIQIDFSAHVILKFDRWARETIGNLFHAPKSYVCHFIAIHVFKLELSSRNAQIGSQIIYFTAPVTLIHVIDGWPRKTIGHLFYATSNFVPHFVGICEFTLELQSGNAQLGWKSSIFCPMWPWNLMDDLDFQLCTSFQSHQWIQTGITVWKHWIWIKITNFFVPCDREILQIPLKK